jgi:hypothetical protein
MFVAWFDIDTSHELAAIFCEQKGAFGHQLTDVIGIGSFTVNEEPLRTKSVIDQTHERICVFLSCSAHT